MTIKEEIINDENVTYLEDESEDILDDISPEAVAYFPVYFFCYMDEDMEVYDGDVFKDLCMAD